MPPMRLESIGEGAWLVASEAQAGGLLLGRGCRHLNPAEKEEEAAARCIGLTRIPIHLPHNRDSNARCTTMPVSGVHRRWRLALPPLLALLLVLALQLHAVVGDDDGVSATTRKAAAAAAVATRTMWRKRLPDGKSKLIGCLHKQRRVHEVVVCAKKRFSVTIGGQPDALQVRRVEAAGGGVRRHRHLQTNGDFLVLSTSADLVVIENDMVIQKNLVMEGTLTIGNLTISSSNVTALQGPPGKRGLWERTGAWLLLLILFWGVGRGERHLYRLDSTQLGMCMQNRSPRPARRQRHRRRAGVGGASKGEVGWR